MGTKSSKSVSKPSEQSPTSTHDQSHFSALKTVDFTDKANHSMAYSSILGETPNPVVIQVVEALIQGVVEGLGEGKKKKMPRRRKKKKGKYTVEIMCGAIVALGSSLQDGKNIATLRNNGFCKKINFIKNIVWKNTVLRKANRIFDRLGFPVFRHLRVPLEKGSNAKLYLPLPLYAVKTGNFELLQAFMKLHLCQLPDNFYHDDFMGISTKSVYGKSFKAAICFLRTCEAKDYFYHTVWTYAHECLNYDFLQKLNHYSFSNSYHCLERLLKLTLLMVENPDRTQKQLVFVTKLLPFLSEKANRLSGRISDSRITAFGLLGRIINLPSIEFASHGEQKGESKSHGEDQTLDGDSFYGGFLRFFKIVLTEDSFDGDISARMGFDYMDRILHNILLLEQQTSCFSEAYKRYAMELLDFMFVLSPYRLDEVASLIENFPEESWIHTELPVVRLLERVEMKRKLVQSHNQIHQILGRDPHDMLQQCEVYSDRMINSLEELVFGMRVHLQELVKNLKSECHLILKLYQPMSLPIHEEYMGRLNFTRHYSVKEFIQKCLIGRKNGFHKMEYDFENGLDKIPDLSGHKDLLSYLKQYRVALDMTCYFSQSAYHEESECPVCMEKSNLEDYPLVKYRLANPDEKICDHFMECCPKCISHFCKMVLRQPKAHCTGRGVKCHTGGCTSIISLEQFLSFYRDSHKGEECSVKDRSKLKETIRELAVAEDPNSTFCGCGNVVSLSTMRTKRAAGESKSCCFSCEQTDAENKFQVKCLKCPKELCLKCGESHRTLSCAENMSKKNGAYLKKTKTRLCPNCSVLINRIAGCDHVQCKTCEYKFCYNCMSVHKTKPRVYWECGSTCSKTMKPF